MLGKIFGLILIICCLICLSALSVSAECIHDFSLAPDKSNLATVEGFIHSYECRNGCGVFGTPAGGENSYESCSFKTAAVTEATCKKEGCRVYVCSVCNRNKYETLPLLKHSYKRVRRPPTCTEKGYDLYCCTVCGISYRDNFTDTLSHISDGGTVEVFPDYGKKGTLKVSCRVCSCVIGRSDIPALVRSAEAVGSVEGFKVKSFGTDSIRLVWKKADGAASYKVLYSTDKKKWKTVATEKNSLTVKKLKEAQRYYFKIYAVGVDGHSGASEALTACTKPERAAVTKLDSTKKSAVKLEWKKLSGVSGYEISYTADSFDNKKSIKTVTVMSGNKKTLKKLKSGKKYRFRVRGFKKHGSKKIYGAYSKVKTVRIR